MLCRYNMIVKAGDLENLKLRPEPWSQFLLFSRCILKVWNIHGKGHQRMIGLANSYGVNYLYNTHYYFWDIKYWGELTKLIIMIQPNEWATSFLSAQMWLRAALDPISQIWSDNRSSAASGTISLILSSWWSFRNILYRIFASSIFYPLINFSLLLTETMCVD